MFFFNEAIVSREKNLYLVGNLGASTLRHTLLTHSFFPPKEYSIRGNLSFEDWRTDPAKAETVQGTSVDPDNQNQNQNNMQDLSVTGTQSPNIDTSGNSFSNGTDADIQNGNNQTASQVQSNSNGNTNQNTSLNTNTNTSNTNNNSTTTGQNPNSNGSIVPNTNNNNSTNSPTNNNTSNPSPILVNMNSFLQIESLHPSTGFFPTSISFTPAKSAFSLGQRPGLIFSPNTSISLTPSPLYFHFKPFPDRTDLPDTSQYSTTQNGVSFSFHDTSEADSQFSRVHTPTFYIRFLIASGSTFPLTLFVKGDIQSKNSLAVVLRASNDLTPPKEGSLGQQMIVFRPQVFFRDRQGVLYNFESDFSFRLDSVHSLSVTYIKLFGNYSQIVTMFDDGEHFSSSSIIHTIIENSSTPLSIFPQVSLLSEIISLESPNSSQGTETEGMDYLYNLQIK